MPRLPIYIVPTPKQRRRAARLRFVPAVLLAALVLAALAVSGAHRAGEPVPSTSRATR